MTHTYYLQHCPTCGRSLQVRIEYMGRKVVCQHCRGAFIAMDPDLEWQDFIIEPSEPQEEEQITYKDSPGKRELVGA
ncbi:MAG: hypothetical protein ACRC2T_06045 [Thermoguttaceae bacterium]